MEEGRQDRENSIIGVFRTRREAERAISALLSACFGEKQLGVLFRGMSQGEELARERGVRESHPAGTGPSRRVSGSGKEVIDNLSLLAVPGIGPVFARGAFESTLTGVAATGILRGLLVGLVGVGISEQRARQYEEHVKRGDILVTVFCETQCDRAQSILTAYAASEVSKYVGRRPSGEDLPRGEVW